VPSRLNLEANRLNDRLEHGDPLWPAQLAIAVSIGLNFTLTKRVTIGPIWLVPAVEGALLAGLIRMAPARASAQHARPRRFALLLTACVTLTSLVSLGLLIHYLVVGGHAVGRELIASGMVLWATNVLLFGVWYWELDQGGPIERSTADDRPLPDFQFPQLENPQLALPGWRPGFHDYLYTSLTNATAFSPTDVMPLSFAAKAVMGLQSVSALATIGLVVARAVNILS
jgi:uncharacterized membrane protein